MERFKNYRERMRRPATKEKHELSRIIAVAGKGGTGKTTTAALIIRHLLRSGKNAPPGHGRGPEREPGRLAGHEVRDTIGSVLSDFMRERAQLPPGMTKQSYLDMKFHQILKEGKDMDMLVMGCPDGPGCYCAANSILKDYFEHLSKNYPYVVVDNEAGMEHFSRKTAARIDTAHLLLELFAQGPEDREDPGRLVDELKIDVGSATSW